VWIGPEKAMIFTVSATWIGVILEQERIIACYFAHGGSSMGRFLDRSRLCLAPIQAIVSFTGREVTLHRSGSVVHM
jgi:hypothetical protein